MPTILTNRALDWNPQGKRKVGRPKETWRISVGREVTESGWSLVMAPAKEDSPGQSMMEKYGCSPLSPQGSNRVSQVSSKSLNVTRQQN